MNILLIFFALPIATIIISAVLEKIIKCPLAVASVIFAIFLIVTFTAFDVSFLVATIIYTILSLITALIVRFICSLRKSRNNTSTILSALVDPNDNSNCGCRRND